MTMFHHDARDYEVAASAAASRARDKFEAQLEGGVEKRNNLIMKLLSDQPTDALVRPGAMEFGVDDGRVTLDFPDNPHGAGAAPVSAHALGHVARMTGGIIGVKNARAMLGAGEWGHELLADVLNRTFGNTERDAVLVRNVPTDDALIERRTPDQFEVRSVHSDRYGRIDSPAILKSALDAADQFGAVPVHYHYDGFRWTLKFYLQHVFEPVANEVMVFGFAIGHSDHKQGALQANFLSQRVWCTNEAIAERVFRRIHLGPKLDVDGDWSGETHMHAQRLLASQIKDVTQGALSAERVNAECSRIREANEAKLSVDEMEKLVARTFDKRGLPKDTQSEITRAFNRPDVELLPAGNTMWRLAQSFGLVAQAETVEETGRKRDAEERLTLESIAGELLDLVAPAPKFDVKSAA